MADAHGVEIGKGSPMLDSTMSFMESGMPGAPMAAWEVGANAARAFRSSYTLPDGPLSDAALGDLCGVRSFASSKRSKTESPIAFTLSGKRQRQRMVFRAKVLTGRRFEAARLLGDKMLVARDDRLRPATQTHTFRQKVQRAFAAELLCPIESLQDSIGSDRSHEAIEREARRYRVSPVLVARHLQNHASSSRFG